ARNSFSTSAPFLRAAPARAGVGVTRPRNRAEPQSVRQRIEPVGPRMRADRYLAQRRPRSFFVVGVDRRSGLRADREFRRVRIVEEDLHTVLALRDVGVLRKELRDLVARQILSDAIGLPDAVDPASENLPGIEVEGDLDRLPRLHVFEVLLKIGREQVT